MNKFFYAILKSLTLSVLVLGTFSTPAARAQDTETLAKIRILPERSTVKAGEELWIGIEQSIKPQWHSYWKNPGDSGSAPRIKWTMPADFTITDIKFPAAHKIPYPPLLNYGYSDHVILLQKLTIPGTIPDGPITLVADFEVLVCKDICVPEFSQHEIILNDPQAIDEHNEKYIETARAQLPEKTNWSVSFDEEGNDFIVEIHPDDITKIAAAQLATLEFLPNDWGLVENTADARAEIIDDALIIQQTRGERPLKAVKTSGGVITFNDRDGARRAYSFTVDNAAHSAAQAALENAATDTPENTEISSDSAHSTTLIKAIFFAVLGGLILNLMPCVFPVLSIKALSLVKIAEKHPSLARLHGLSYSAGVILSFLAIAALLIILKASGAGIGWGFQLQNPIVVSVLAYILFLVGLNLSGYFEISGRFGNVGNKLTQSQGLGGSFFTGILATLVATPCSAPFMALAVGYALLQPSIIGLGVFAALGFGLALPYLVLSFAPPLLKALPKPGAWMEKFRQLLAFPMFASAAWLTWVLSQQAGSMGVLGLLFGAVAITFGLWLLRIAPASGRLKILTKTLAIIAFLIPIALLPAGAVNNVTTPLPNKEFGQTYSAEKLGTLLEGDDPIFVEMTAAWCITCKVNHAVAINKDSTRAAFETHNVQYLIGDWTNYDAHITEFLNKYGHQGVPLYVYYGPRDTSSGERPVALVLPQILTPNIIKNTVTTP